MSAEHTPPRGRAQSWRQAATMLALFGLVVTLLFNTIGVWQGVQHDNQARDLAQIALLPELNSSLRRTERAINTTSAAQNRCNPVRPLSLADGATLHDALDYHEYLAWLFNHRRLTLANTRTLFGPALIDGWRLARHYFGIREVSYAYPELTQFAHATPRKQRPPTMCAPSPRQTRRKRPIPLGTPTRP